jgi:hypothetical protein
VGGFQHGNNRDVEEVSQTQNDNPKCQSEVPFQRGRSRKRGVRSKHSNPSVPKFIQIAEAMRDGGAKQRRKRRGQSRKYVQRLSDITIEGVSTTDGQEVELVSAVPGSPQGLMLEVVLPIFATSSRVDIVPNSNEGATDCQRERSQQECEASKLLSIQSQIVFCYKDQEGEVIKVLVDEESRDRLKKEEWEQRNSYQ